MNPHKMGAIAVFDRFFKDRQDFPTLDALDVYVTDQYDQAYNCISWSLGLTDEWVEPGSLADMRAVYEARGFSEVTARSADAEVDVMGKSSAYVTHATTIYRGPQLAGMPAGLWESKLAEDLRITHGRFALEGPLYGQVLASFRRNVSGKSVAAAVEVVNVTRKQQGGGGGKGRRTGRSK